MVVTDPEKLAQMADANGRPAEPLRKAAAGILVCGDLDRAFRFAKDYWVIDGAIAAQNICLAAQELGLAADGPGRSPEKALRFAGDHRAPLHHRPRLPGSGHHCPSCEPLPGRPGAFQPVVNRPVAKDRFRSKTEAVFSLRRKLVQLSCVDFGEMRPIQGHTLFLFCPQSSNPWLPATFFKYFSGSLFRIKSA